MKILMLSKALVSGAYHKKIEELAKLGASISLVLPPKWGELSCEVTAANGYDIYKVPIFFNGYNHFHFYRGLNAVFNKVRPDIIHIDEEHYSCVTYQAMHLAVRNKIKSVFFTWQNINKKYPFPFSYIERYNFSHANAAIAGNVEAKEILQQKGFSKNISVIPQFGVDPDLFRRKDTSMLKKSLGLHDGDFIIGFVGRVVEEKGLTTLIHALPHIDAKCRLLIVGGGNFSKDLVALERRQKVESRVSFLHNVKSMEVPDVINCCDCIVLPSLTKPNWKEQFGRILIEAMSCEVPVIGSDSGEIPNVIGEAGILFHEGDCIALAKAVSKLAKDSALKTKFAIAGRQRVLNFYTQHKIAEDTFAVYKSIL